jgi:hypothetical protein
MMSRRSTNAARFSFTNAVHLFEYHAGWDHTVGWKVSESGLAGAADEPGRRLRALVCAPQCYTCRRCEPNAVDFGHHINCNDSYITVALGQYPG